MSEFHEFGKVTSDSQAWALLVPGIQSQPKGCSFLSVTKIAASLRPQRAQIL